MRLVRSVLQVRKALELREFEGLRYREIGVVMELSLNEVKVLLHRGRKLLARRLAALPDCRLILPVRDAARGERLAAELHRVRADLQLRVEPVDLERKAEIEKRLSAAFAPETIGVDEIIGQVWVVVRTQERPLTNVVLMGMGEPLANFDAVLKAMNIMQDDLAYMLSKYRVTVSTSGIVPAIYRLRQLSDVSLAVSLHAPDDQLRDQLVPINRKYPLEQLIPACRAFSMFAR